MSVLLGRLLWSGAGGSRWCARCLWQPVPSVLLRHVLLGDHFLCGLGLSEFLLLLWLRGRGEILCLLKLSGYQLLLLYVLL